MATGEIVDMPCMQLSELTIFKLYFYFQNIATRVKTTHRFTKRAAVKSKSSSKQ